MHLYKRVRLGWLQQTILLMLWNREMYGLQIQRYLKFRGEKVGPGQLYPALKKLYNMKTISFREEIREGANRKYYKITEVGKELIRDYLVSALSIFELIMIEKLSFVFDEAINLIEIKAGSIVLDISNPVFEENRLLKLAPLTAPTGRYFITSPNKEYTDLLKDRVEYEKLEEFISIVERQIDSIPLPDKSCDIVVVFFTIHEDNTNWIIDEMRRVLKPNGKGLIIDNLAIKGHIREEIVPEYLPNHSRTGLDIDILLPLLNENELEITYQKSEKGIIYLIVNPVKT